MKLTRLTSLALIACSFLSTAAQNLVPNPSFEEYEDCPNDYGDSFKLKNWFTAIANPDYYNVCYAGDDTCGVPMNVSGFQYPATGDGYIGMITYTNDPPDGFRELIGVRLTEPLSIGETYYTSFMVSCTNGYPNLDNWTRYAANMLGIRLRQDSVTGNSWFPIENIAQFTSDIIVTDSSQWTMLSGSFVAQDNAQWLYLGNFFDHANVSTAVIDEYCPDEFAYYYFDDVCLSREPGACAMVTATPDDLGRTAPRAWVAPGSGMIAVTSLPIGRYYQYEAFDSVGRLIIRGRLSTEGTIPIQHTEQLVILRLWDGNVEWRFKLPVLSSNQ